MPPQLPPPDSQRALSPMGPPQPPPAAPSVSNHTTVARAAPLPPPPFNPTYPDVATVIVVPWQPPQPPQLPTKTTVAPPSAPVPAAPPTPVVPPSPLQPAASPSPPSAPEPAPPPAPSSPPSSPSSPEPATPPGLPSPGPPAAPSEPLAPPPTTPPAAPPPGAYLLETCLNRPLGTDSHPAYLGTEEGSSRTECEARCQTMKVDNRRCGFFVDDGGVQGSRSAVVSCDFYYTTSHKWQQERARMNRGGNALNCKYAGAMYRLWRKPSDRTAATHAGTPALDPPSAPPPRSPETSAEAPAETSSMSDQPQPSPSAGSTELVDVPPGDAPEEVAVPGDTSEVGGGANEPSASPAPGASGAGALAIDGLIAEPPSSPPSAGAVPAPSGGFARLLGFETWPAALQMLMRALPSRWLRAVPPQALWAPLFRWARPLQLPFFVLVLCCLTGCCCCCCRPCRAHAAAQTGNSGNGAKARQRVRNGGRTKLPACEYAVDFAADPRRNSEGDADDAAAADDDHISAAAWPATEMGGDVELIDMTGARIVPSGRPQRSLTRSLSCTPRVASLALHSLIITSLSPRPVATLLPRAHPCLRHRLRHMHEATLRTRLTRRSARAHA